MKKEIEKIAFWIRDYYNSTEGRTIIIGLSGGIDSAVVAALCVKAVGVKNVVGVIMPCDSDPLDRIDGVRVAENLGIEYHVDDLTPTFERYLLDSPMFGEELTQGNIKARLRMLHLYAYANFVGGVVSGTCNRSEIAIGYFTKGGDGQADFEPLVQYYKTEVYAMAKFLPIPQETIDRAPTAGLSPDQTDEKDIGMSYEDLDYILKRLDYNWAGEFNKEKLIRALNLIRRSEHKRQAMPIYERETE